MTDIKKLFRVVDNSGKSYFIEAENLANAYTNFREWEKTQYNTGDEIEEPQSISCAGELCSWK